MSTLKPPKQPRRPKKKRIKKKFIKLDWELELAQHYFSWRQNVLYNMLADDAKAREAAMDEAHSEWGRPWVKMVVYHFLKDECNVETAGYVLLPYCPLFKGRNKSYKAWVIQQFVTEKVIADWCRENRIQEREL